MTRTAAFPGGAGTLHDLAAQAPRRAARATLWTLLALVAALFAWSLTAQLDIVAVAPGKLVPVSQVKTVQVAEAGIVREILVRDGERVVAGQPLLRMDATLAGAERQQLAQEMALRRLAVRAIEAALAGERLAREPGDPPRAFAQVQAQFSARRQALEDSVQQEVQAALRARGERAAALQTLEKLRATLPVIRQSAESYARLQAEGFVGELLANEKRREAIEREQDLKAQEAMVQALDAAIAQAEQRVVQLRSTFRSQLLAERTEAQATVDRLRSEQEKLGFRSALLELRAPQDGTVHNLAVHTLGAVAPAGTALLRLVPVGEPLRAEAALANEDVGFVEVGQAVKVKLAAYPFQKYGLIEGRIVQISADAQDSENTGGTRGSLATAPLAYQAVIELDAQALPLPDGTQLALAPGMLVTAEIHQGRRTVMEYLLSPVQRVSAEAGRER